MSDSIAEKFSGHTPGDPVTRLWEIQGVGLVSKAENADYPIHLGVITTPYRPSGSGTDQERDANQALVCCAPLIPALAAMLERCAADLPTDCHDLAEEARALLALLEGGKS